MREGLRRTFEIMWAWVLGGAVVLLVGCTTVTIPATGFSVQGTVTHTEDKTTPNKVVNEEKYNLTPEAAKLKLKLERERTKQIRAQAQAEALARGHHSGGSGQHRPSRIRGYGGGY